MINLRGSRAARRALCAAVVLSFLGCDTERGEQAKEPQAPRDGEIAKDTLEVPREGGMIEVVRRAPEQVQAGDRFEYTVTVKNTSDQPVQNILVSERFVGAGVAWNDAGQGAGSAVKEGEREVPTGGVAGQKDAMSWEIDQLAPGEERVFQVTGVAREPGTVTSRLSVRYRVQPSMESQLDVVAPEMAASVVLVDADGKASDAFYACDEEAVLRVRVQNTGTGTARGVMLVGELPAGVTADGEQQLQVEIGDIEAGETAEEEVELALEEADRRDLTLPVQVSGEGLEPVREEVAFRVLHPALNLHVQGPQQAEVGQTVQLKVVLENTSQDPAVETTLQIEAPDGAEDFTLSGGEGDEEELQIGYLPAGERREVTASFRVTEPGELRMNVTASARCVEELSHEVALQVAGVAALRVEVIDQKDPVGIGEETTYELNVKNQGSAEEVNVQIMAEIPPEFEFVEASGDFEGQQQGRNVVFTIPALGAGDEAKMEIKVRARSGQQGIFRVHVNSDAVKSAIQEEEPTTIQGQAQGTQQLPDETGQPPQPEQGGEVEREVEVEVESERE